MDPEASIPEQPTSTEPEQTPDQVLEAVPSFKYIQHLLKQLETQVEQLRSELAASAEEPARLRKVLQSVQSERDELVRQMELQSKRGSEQEELLQALVHEVEEREEAAFNQRQRFEEEGNQLREQLKSMQEREENLTEQLGKVRETATKVADTGGRDSEELAGMIEQVEAEIREQQDLIHKERAALARERHQLEEWRRSLPGELTAPLPPSASGPRMLRFACKYCQNIVQAKEFLAGLVTRCPHCNKMTSVPKQGV